MVVSEMEQEGTQEYTEDDLEMVSINSLCFNKSCSMLTTKLKMSVDNNNMVILYKIDTGSEGNIMPWVYFQNIISQVTNSQLAKPLKTYKTKNLKQNGYNSVRNMCSNNRI